MPDCVILKDELSGHGSTEAEGKGSGAIEFLIAEGANCIRGFPAVFEQELDSFVAAGVSTFRGMFGVDVGYDFPADISDAFAGGDGLRDARFNGIHTGDMMDDDAGWTALFASFSYWS
jgi:hypothetical protein